MKRSSLWFFSLSLLALAACASSSKHENGDSTSNNNHTQAIKGAPAEGALTREQASTRSKQVSKIAYSLWFGLSDEGKEFEGRTVIRFEFSDKARDLSKYLLVDLESAKVKKLILNGKEIENPADHYDGHWIEIHRDNLKAGSNRLEIAYSHAYATDGKGLHRFKDPVDGNVYLYTHFEPYDAHRAFPCFDQPDLKASYELTVETPPDWSVISNTPEREVNKVDGRRSWAFPPSPVFSTYLFALHAGPYSSWKSDANGIPIKLYARKSLAQYVDHAEWFEVTKQGLEFYGAEFGYPYPFAKYDQIIVPDFNAGAMENVGAVTFSERFIYRSKVTRDRRRSRAEVILHEMAHMWFGDLVTMRWWNGLWLNESFATFMAAHATEEATQFNGTWQAFFASDKQWAYWEDQLKVTHPIETSVANTSAAFSHFDGITYGKGASVIKQLRFFLGDDDFREGIQRYFLRFAFRNTTLADFMHALAEGSGRQLTDWQRMWIQTAGVNVIEPVWSCKEGKIDQFSIKQSNGESGGVLRPHRTKLALYSRSGGVLAPKSVLNVEYSKAENPVSEAIGKPCPAFVFPNHEDMDYAKVSLDPVSLGVVQSSLGQITDPFARQMMWHTLWEMVVDGKLAAQDFAETAIKHIAHERDTQVLQKVLRSLTATEGKGAAVLRYASDEIRPSLWTKIENFTRKHLESSPAGSDLQLIWLGAFENVAQSEASLDYLRSLLKGKAKLKGLTVDQERRWEMIQTLAKAGASEAPALIAEELKKDPTDFGKKESFAAEASTPSVDAKNLWLKRFIQSTSHGEFRFSELRTAMGAWQSLGQERFSQDLKKTYFEELPKVAKREDEDYARAFAGNLFPALCTPDMIESTTDLLKHEGDFPPGVVKSLKVNLQETERCIRARKRSSQKEAENHGLGKTDQASR